jgi:hypothetical protein
MSAMECRPDADAPPATRRDLLVVEKWETAGSAVRPLAGFVAQLLACRDGAPLLRARRRAAPAEAVSCYRGPAVPVGQGAFSRRI